MKVGGRNYRIRDIVVLPDGTVRRRKLRFFIFSHHNLRKEESADLVSTGVEAVAAGTGTSPHAKLSGEARTYAAEAQLELIELPSPEAIQKFNQLADLGKKVSALTHITC